MGSEGIPMPKTRQIAATRAFGLKKVVQGRHVVRVAVGPRFDPIILSLDAPPDYRKTAPSGAASPSIGPTTPNRYRIDHFQNGQWRSITLSPTRENFHCVQPLGDDGWLLVRGQAKGNSDQNAHVYDSDGTLSRSFHAGDGIEDVQTTEDGRTWVRYFDEGVFGDTTLGQAGLVCLDRSGQVTFRFDNVAAT